MKIINLVVMSLLIFSCQTQQENIYTKQVGDILFDNKIDDPKFKICDSSNVLQYYMFGKGLQYNAEKFEIIKYFKEKYRQKNIAGETGYITIRFLINCKGKSGMFRVYGMDMDYNPKDFNKDISDQLLNITKSLDGWIVGKHEGKLYDYYQYLTFKIEDGELIEILP